MKDVWSSSPDVRFGVAAWVVSFGGGYVGSGARGNSEAVRLVRIGH